MKEHDIQNSILDVLNFTDGEFFRVNVLAGFIGRYFKNRDGSVTIFNPSYVKSGVPKGFPDIIGVKPRLITADDVGSKIGQFAFLEVKNESGKPTKDQILMHQTLLKAGAIGGIARDIDDALNILYRK